MHDLKLKCLDDSGTAWVEHMFTTDEEFVKLYLSGQYHGYPILSMEWTHKGETHKLVFGR